MGGRIAEAGGGSNAVRAGVSPVVLRLAMATVGLVAVGLAATATLSGIGASIGPVGCTFRVGHRFHPRVNCDGVLLVGWWVYVDRSGQLYYHDTAPDYWLPYPALYASLAVCPAVWLALWGRERRRVAARRTETCVACGYDLRATPGQCPECGRVPASETEG